MIADFETGQDVNNVVSGRTGPWTNYNSSNNAMPLYPTSTTAGIFPADSPGLNGSNYALHFKDGTYTQYCGFGAPFNGTLTGIPNAYDVSAYDGIQFDIKSAASQDVVYFEFLGQESRPAANGGTAPPSSTPNPATGNTRGYFLAGTGGFSAGTGTTLSTTLSTTAQTVTVPFSLLVPRFFPSNAASSCPAGTTNCYAPQYVPAHALGLQLSMFPDFSKTGTYELWVDNVKFYTGDNGLTPPNETMPTFNDGATGWNCGTSTPTFLGSKKAAGKYLLWGYHNWKSFFLKAAGAGELVVQSPEVNGGSVVSEGIAYGMLLAAYFNDKATFDGLWTYWANHKASGTTYLMNWEYSMSSPDGSPTGSGSATDADEDAAFANYLASKIFTGGSYSANYNEMVGEILSKDIDGTTHLPTYGSNANGSGTYTNPSYFAPAYYRIFETATGGAGFSAVIGAVYTALANSQKGGLPPAWCQTSDMCTTAGGGSYPNAQYYQYDAHRVPWRIGLDYCWGGGGSQAQTYLASVSGTFSNLAKNGIGYLVDEYALNGVACAGCNPTPENNSMSLDGTAAVGAMAAGTQYSSFINQVWQFTLDGLNRGKPNVDLASNNLYYSYYNATVGLLTGLTMSGNFYKM